MTEHRRSNRVEACGQRNEQPGGERVARTRGIAHAVERQRRYLGALLTRLQQDGGACALLDHREARADAFWIDPVTQRFGLRSVAQQHFGAQIGEELQQRISAEVVDQR